MKKIIRLSLANIKKHKKETVLLTILVVLCITLLSSSLSAVNGIGQVTPSMVKESECYKNQVYFNQDVYSDKYLGYFEKETCVEDYDHTSMVTADVIKVKKSDEKGEGTLTDLSFVPESGERKLEKFDIDADFSSVEHPIVLDLTNKEDLEVSKGDEIIITVKKKEYKFTVVGFYSCGIWNYGSKAVVCEEDFSLLENSLDRYEVVGINTVEGTDNTKLLEEFKSFAQDASLNDLTTSVSLYSYEDIVTNNETNMGLTSIIIIIMAAVIVIAIMIMIRFRIVSDIKDQIVSIGVLEALGYTSKDIALSYIFEYVIIAIASAIISIIPANALAKAQIHNAATSVHYSGDVNVPKLPMILCIFAIILFIGIIAFSRAMVVRKYPPVLAFRRGIETHNFKKTFVPLEKTKGNIHIALAIKEFLQGAKNQIGLSVCIAACTVMVLVSFIAGISFIDTDKVLKSVCGHELCDIRIEGTVDIDPDAFAKELEEMPEIEQVLMPIADAGVKINDSENPTKLEVYEDYGKTKTIVLTEGRLPEHENEIALTVQAKKNADAQIGDTITLEYGKVKKSFLVTGTVNCVMEPTTAYITTDGFIKMNPSYVPSVFDIYLSDASKKDEVVKLLKERYGKEIAEYKEDEISGDTLEERIRSAANIKMAKAMTEKNVSYMEYAIQVGDKVIKGSSSAMKIKEMTFVYEDNKEIAKMFRTSFGGVAIIMMIMSAIVVTLILSILMSSTIRNQYKELGIMKSLGYTSKELMFQMAFRIIPVALIAVIIGTLLSIPVMALVSTLVWKIQVPVITVVIVDVMILAFCFICAFLCARKIKKISAYELITE